MTQDPVGMVPHLTNLIIWAPKENNDSNYYALNNKEKSIILSGQKYKP